MKQELNVLLQIFSHSTMELVNKLSHFEDIKVDVLINLVINYVATVFIICHTNNIDNEKTKQILDEGVVIILDYIIISKEECLSTEQYKSKYNDAIHFSLQKTIAKLNTSPKHKIHHRINKTAYKCITILRDIYIFFIMLELQKSKYTMASLKPAIIFTIEKNITAKLISIIIASSKHSNNSSANINSKLGQLLFKSHSPTSNESIATNTLYSTIEQILLASGSQP